MPALVIIGTQWGDEGKGKLVDRLTGRADWVVRFQGGDNAGHTLVVGGKTIKLRLTPSDIMRPQARCLIGAGVVINPETLLQEMEGLKDSGADVSPGRIVIDYSAHLILDYHPMVDRAREQALGDRKIGTTGRGIGPVYEDRYARRGVRCADLLSLDTLKEDLRLKTEEKNRYLRDVLGSSEQADFEALWGRVCRWAERLTPYIGNGSLLIHRALADGKNVVFEGAQASMLDCTFGTVPFVTASNTLAGAATTGCGIGPRSIDCVLGVTKAYSTRVGAGPFPTELLDACGDRIRERGGEYGTVTGRPRRCGWFDAVVVQRSVRLNGCSSLALTKLDVLSGIEKLRICTGYELDGKMLEDVPPLLSDIERVKPRYVELDGWEQGLSGCTRMADLPAQARRYISALEESGGCPISTVGVGADRDATIMARPDPALEEFLKA